VVWCILHGVGGSIFAATPNDTAFGFGAFATRRWNVDDSYAPIIDVRTSQVCKYLAVELISRNHRAGRTDTRVAFGWSVSISTPDYTAFHFGLPAIGRRCVDEV